MSTIPNPQMKPTNPVHKPSEEELHKDRVHAMWTLLIVALIFGLIAVAAIWGGAPEQASYNDWYLP